MRSTLSFLTVMTLVTTLILSACSPVIAQRGNMLEQNQNEQVVIGVHSRTDILRILGSPTTTAPFDDKVWYYIGQETAKRGILDPAVEQEEIYIVRFNDKGTVTALENADQGRIDVPLSRDKTPTHGNDITVLQEFLCNLGRFNPNAGQVQGGRR